MLSITRIWNEGYCSLGGADACWRAELGAMLCVHGATNPQNLVDADAPYNDRSRRRDQTLRKDETARPIEDRCLSLDPRLDLNGVEIIKRKTDGDRKPIDWVAGAGCAGRQLHVEEGREPTTMADADRIAVSGTNPESESAIRGTDVDRPIDRNELTGVGQRDETFWDVGIDCIGQVVHGRHLKTVLCLLRRPSRRTGSCMRGACRRPDRILNAQ